MANEAMDVNVAESSTTDEVEVTDVNDEALSSGAEAEPDVTAEAEEEETLLSVIQDTVKETRDDVGPEDSLPSEEGDEQPPTAEVSEASETEETDELVTNDGDTFSEAEFSALKDKTKRRFEALLKERNVGMQAQSELQQLNDVLHQNHISGEEMGDMMRALAQYKAGDFDGFMQLMNPYIQHSSHATGQALPQDIQERLDDGYIDEAAAKELSQARAVHAHQQQMLEHGQRDQQAAIQAAAQAQVQIQAGDIRDSVNRWEADIRSRDADYDRKAEMIRTNSEVLMARHGRPANAQQALQLAQDAYAMTNETLKTISPDAKPVKPGPTSSHVPSQHASTKPTSMLEAVRLGLRRHNTGA